MAVQASSAASGNRATKAGATSASPPLHDSLAAARTPEAVQRALATVGLPYRFWRMHEPETVQTWRRFPPGFFAPCYGLAADRDCAVANAARALREVGRTSARSMCSASTEPAAGAHLLNGTPPLRALAAARLDNLLLSRRAGGSRAVSAYPPTPARSPSRPASRAAISAARRRPGIPIKSRSLDFTGGAR